MTKFRTTKIIKPRHRKVKDRIKKVQLNLENILVHHTRSELIIHIKHNDEKAESQSLHEKIRKPHIN